jgi:dihydroorotase
MTFSTGVCGYVENSEDARITSKMFPMTYDLILRGGEIVTGRDRFMADVAIKDSKIAAIGQLGSDEALEIANIEGLTILPGVIDTQVHFREPGLEQKEDIATGTQSAAMGGVTTVFEMPNTSPPTTTAELLADKVKRSEGRSWCNIAFFVGASAENVGELADLENLPGTPGIKIFMGSSTGSLLVPDDETLRKVLKAGRKRTPVHAEDYYRLEERKSLISANPTAHEHPFLRDAECARLATDRLIRLSEETGRPVHVLHVSTADELPLLAVAKGRGIDVTAEVTPQHLWFAAPECYDQLGTLAQMNPPVRTGEHRAAIRNALTAGLFDMIGSDHAPHTLEEKSLPYPKSPSGMPGVQTLLPIMLTLAQHAGLLTLQELVRLTSENPARLYHVVNKGHIEVGYDADLAIVDLRRKETIQRKWVASKCGWSPFEGVQVHGWPVHTIVNGQFAVRENELQPTPHGRTPKFGL